MNQLKKLRVLNEMTQIQMAKKLGISQALYSLIESGKHKPSKKVMREIEKLFGVSLYFID
jgi:putative transcriptional regulator